MRLVRALCIIGASAVSLAPTPSTAQALSDGPRVRFEPLMFVIALLQLVVLANNVARCLRSERFVAKLHRHAYPGLDMLKVGQRCLAVSSLLTCPSSLTNFYIQTGALYTITIYFFDVGITVLLFWVILVIKLSTEAVYKSRNMEAPPLVNCLLLGAIGVMTAGMVLTFGILAGLNAEVGWCAMWASHLVGTAILSVFLCFNICKFTQLRGQVGTTEADSVMHNMITSHLHRIYAFALPMAVSVLVFAYYFVHDLQSNDNAFPSDFGEADLVRWSIVGAFYFLALAAVSLLFWRQEAKLRANITASERSKAKPRGATLKCNSPRSNTSSEVTTEVAVV